MKRIILFVGACYASLIAAYGQSLIITGEMEDPLASVEHVLQYIDYGPVTSHILLDRTLPMGKISAYVASSESDSTYCDMWLLDQQFTNLLTASLPTYPYTADILDYKDDWAAYQPSSTVPLVLMAMDYHMFKASAVDDGINRG